LRENWTNLFKNSSWLGFCILTRQGIITNFNQGEFSMPTERDKNNRGKNGAKGDKEPDKSDRSARGGRDTTKDDTSKDHKRGSGDNSREDREKSGSKILGGGRKE
jgi:hypothetical protein